MRCLGLIPSKRAAVVWTAAWVFFGAIIGSAQQGEVTARVEISRIAGTHGSGTGMAIDASNVVVWLTPMDPVTAARAPQREIPQLVQRNKTFEPHLLVIQAGSVVQFPNKDPFLHNVFSLFDGKRFDLGFYEAGTSRSVRFERAGVSYLFCNIHPDMSAVVVAVDTPYFAQSDRGGHVTLRDVPDGRYRMQVWYERSPEDDLKAQSRLVTISASARTLPTIELAENPNFTLAHKNKYGSDYAPPAADKPY